MTTEWEQDSRWPDRYGRWGSAADDGPAMPWVSAFPGPPDSELDDEDGPDATEAELAALDEVLAAGRAELEAHIAATVDVEAGLRAILGDRGDVPPAERP